MASVFAVPFVFLAGSAGSRVHSVEFTCCHGHPVVLTPTPDDLLVFYVPEAHRWQAMCADMPAAGFVRVPS